MSQHMLNGEKKYEEEMKENVSGLDVNVGIKDN